MIRPVLGWQADEALMNMSIFLAAESGKGDEVAMSKASTDSQPQRQDAACAPHLFFLHQARAKWFDGLLTPLQL